MVYFGLYRQSFISPVLVAYGAIAFVFATLYLSPDLDIVQSRVTKNWKVFSFLWRGYSRLFSHRGWSHSIFLASFTRLLYLGLVSISFGFLLNFLWNYYHFHEVGRSMAYVKSQMEHKGHFSWVFFKSYRYYFLSVFVGVLIADLFHIIFDRIFSSIKILLGIRRS